MNQYALAAIFAAGLASGWLANGWRLGQDMQEERNAWAESERQRIESERKESDARALAVWAEDQRAQQEIAEREQKLLEFERCIAAGRGCGLRVRVVTKAASCVPAGEAAGVGSGAVETAELAPELRPDYRALRTGIAELEQALKVCIAASEDIAP